MAQKRQHTASPLASHSTSDRIGSVTIQCGKKDHFIEQLIAALRINKSCIVNLKNIDAIRAYLDRRLLITMSNGEQLIVSRQYAPELKHLLGVK